MKECTLLRECKVCGKAATLNNFHKKKGALHGVSSKCKECTSKYHKQKKARDKVEKAVGVIQHGPFPKGNNKRSIQSNGDGTWQYLD